MTPSFEARVLPRLPKVRSYLRSIQVGQLLQGDVTHRLAGSLQDSARIIQVGATRESEEYVSGTYTDVADAVLDDSFRRAIQQNHLRAHLEDVLMTRSHLLMDDLPKPEGKRLDGGIVPIEEFEQLAWRSCHATLAGTDRYFLPRYTSSVSASPCDVVLAPMVMNVMVKLSFGTDPCQCIMPPGM